MSSSVLSCLPELYFRKWVAINNFRLWSVQMVSYVLILAGVLYVLIEIPAYDVEVKPEVRMKMWLHSNTAIPSAPTPSYCRADAAAYDYFPDDTGAWRFEGRPGKLCAQVASRMCSSDAAICLPVSEVAHSQDSIVFVATSLVEEKFDAITGTHHRESYLVPNAEKAVIGGQIDFQVDVPSSAVHSLFGMDLMPSPQIETVLLDKNGKEAARYMSKTDKVEVLTVEGLLQQMDIDLDAPIEGRLEEFPDNMDPDSNTETRPKARVTGMDITLLSELSNQFSDASFDGVVAKMTIQALPAWSTHTVILFLDSEGSTVTRTYHGIRVHRERRGTLGWFQLNQVIYTWSLYSAWLQVPFLIAFYFAVLCLGTLSDVYCGFLYEEVDLHREFNGVSARMLELSYGFHDLHDQEERDGRVWGATKHRVQNRMDAILEHDKDLDKTERQQFTNFLFGLCSSTMPSGENRAIQLEDYRRPHMKLENLVFEDVLQIVDSDRSSGNILERIFMDDSLKEFSAVAERADAEILGKVKRKLKCHDEHIPSSKDIMAQARKERSIKNLGRTDTIARCRYGQEVIDEQMRTMEKAFNKMYNKCEDVQTTNGEI
mmetsp:Transcript_49613/g.156159  ORF Transcript_49613/g.156159 Transcript_49613/m.156159 type:complete len:600 (+) Transcript_49613:46-1845(+)